MKGYPYFTIYFLAWLNTHARVDSCITNGIKKYKWCPGQIAQLIRGSFHYAKVVGSIPSEGTYKNQSINAYMSGTANQCFFLSSFLSLTEINT